MKNVKLRPFLASDADTAVQIIRSNAVKRSYMLPDLSEEGARELFCRLMKMSFDNRHYVRAIAVDDRMVGWLNDTGLRGDALELGWVVHPDFQNKGYATSAVGIAFSELREKQYKKVLAGAFSDNAASIRVMEKSGMHRIELTEEIEYRNLLHKCVYFTYEL